MTPYYVIRKIASMAKHLKSSQLTVAVGYRGSTVVKVLCYKSEGRWFDPNWCHWIFSLT